MYRCSFSIGWNDGVKVNFSINEEKNNFSLLLTQTLLKHPVVVVCVCSFIQFGDFYISFFVSSFRLSLFSFPFRLNNRMYNVFNVHVHVHSTYNCCHRLLLTQSIWLSFIKQHTHTHAHQKITQIHRASNKRLQCAHTFVIIWSVFSVRSSALFTFVLFFIFNLIYWFSLSMCWFISVALIHEETFCTHFVLSQMDTQLNATSEIVSVFDICFAIGI